MLSTQHSAPGQPQLFRHLRLQLARNGFRVALEAGRLRMLSMIGTSMIVAIFAYGSTWYLFHELSINNIPFKGAIVSRLFDMLFFTLGSMLIFSTGIILYASLFTSPEARYLLTTPAKAEHIFATKFMGAIAFSSWAFVVLGVPIFLAYAFSAGVPWYFYALLPIFLFGYVLLPGSISAGLCLLLVRFMPRNRRQFIALLSTILAGGAVAWLIRFIRAARRSLMTQGQDIDDLIGQFDAVRSGLTPSHWMTQGLMAAARGEIGEVILPLALVWSNGLVGFIVAAWLARRFYRIGFDRLAGNGRGKKIYRASILDRVMESLVFYLPRPTRVLVVKDFRTFRRDPTQWALLIIFAVLMMIGAMNFRQAYTANLAVMDQYAISLMNLGGTAILLCAGLSRFIYPLISLEGRKFWILGLTPIDRKQILWGKFAFAATGSLIIAEMLMLTSDLLIGLPFEGVALHALAIGVVALGLSGLNVGLGACLPNFRETDPSKIVVGFGGTVNMAMGLMFLVCVIGLIVVPFHISELTRVARGGASHSLWVFVGIPVGVIFGILAIILPLRFGRRSLTAMEF